MKRLLGFSVVALAGLYVLSTQVNAQKSSAPPATRPLVLTEAIPLEGVKGRSLWVCWQPVICFCAWKQYSRSHRHQRENRSPHRHRNSESSGCGFFLGSQQTLCRELQGKAVHLRRNFF